MVILNTGSNNLYVKELSGTFKNWCTLMYWYYHIVEKLFDGLVDTHITKL